MRLRLSDRLELVAVVGLPLLVAASALMLAWKSGASIAVLLAFAGLLGVFAVVGGRWVRAAFRRFAQHEAHVRELEELREREQARETAAKVKRARGRRDAFNEVLLGLEARAAEVQRDRDNLEQLVQKRTLELQQRNHAMRLVLDNVEQGLATIQLDGSLSAERSLAFDRWFGAGRDGVGFERIVSPSDERVQSNLRMSWEQLTSGIFPLDLCIEQMPTRLRAGTREYALNYRPILDKDELQGALLVVNDVTDELARDRRDVRQRELIGLFERAMRDRGGTFEFMEEVDQLVYRVMDPSQKELPQILRLLHTIKGSSALYGVGSVAEIAHRIESAVEERQSAPVPEQLQELERAWRDISTSLHRLLGASGQGVVEMAPADFERLERALERRAPHAEIEGLLAYLRQEPVLVRLRRAADQAQAVARRLGKPELAIELNAARELRLPTSRWAAFWAAFVHALQNAVDHGIETPEQREALGKAPAGKLVLSAWTEQDSLFIELEDDGKGIDWERVRERARARGVPHETESELTLALFADGLSTTDRVTQTSGRGVGMGAVRAATEDLGGTLRIQSTRGVGTAIRFSFPLAAEIGPTPNSRRAEGRALN